MQHLKKNANKKKIDYVAFGSYSAQMRTNSSKWCAPNILESLVK